MQTLLTSYDLILASGSPRRKELLTQLGISFKVIKSDVEEVFPTHLKKEKVARFLAELKASSWKELKKNELLITADTIVCLEDQILNKPKDYQEAFNMLQLLSGKKHEVITAVCLRSADQQKTFHSTTSVYFKSLTDEEIKHYIEHYRPYDKAGGYGIQEWIGLIGIEKIEGSYFNVVGLPVKELYEALQAF